MPPPKKRPAAKRTAKKAEKKADKKADKKAEKTAKKAEKTAKGHKEKKEQNMGALSQDAIESPSSVEEDKAEKAADMKAVEGDAENPSSEEQQQQSHSKISCWSIAVSVDVEEILKFMDERPIPVNKVKAVCRDLLASCKEKQQVVHHQKKREVTYRRPYETSAKGVRKTRRTLPTSKEGAEAAKKKREEEEQQLALLDAGAEDKDDHEDEDDQWQPSAVY